MNDRVGGGGKRSNQHRQGSLLLRAPQLNRNFLILSLDCDTAPPLEGGKKKRTPAGEVFFSPSDFLWFGGKALCTDSISSSKKRSDVEKRGTKAVKKVTTVNSSLASCQKNTTRVKRL